MLCASGAALVDVEGRFMFVGALNQKALAWLKAQSHLFAGREVVVGCSGSFSTELMLMKQAVPVSAIHGNDVALFSYVLGMYLCGRTAEVRPRADAPAWLHEAWAMEGQRPVGAVRVAVLHLMLEMMPFVKHRNAHQRRMWDGYARQFPDLVRLTAENVAALPRTMTSFTLGDVFDHFRAHDSENAVFVCYAPTYAGGYEKMYAALDAFVFATVKPRQ